MFRCVQLSLRIFSSLCVCIFVCSQSLWKTTNIGGWDKLLANFKLYTRNKNVKKHLLKPFSYKVRTIYITHHYYQTDTQYDYHTLPPMARVIWYYTDILLPSLHLHVYTSYSTIYTLITCSTIYTLIILICMNWGCFFIIIHVWSHEIMLYL